MVPLIFRLASWFLLTASLLLLAVAWIPLFTRWTWGLGLLLGLTAAFLLWRHRERATERSRNRVRRALRWILLALVLNIGANIVLQTLSHGGYLMPLKRDLETMRPRTEAGP